MTRQTAWLCPDCDGTGQGDELLRATWDDPAESADCPRCRGNGWLDLADGDDSMQPLSARSPGAWNNWLPRYERRTYRDPLITMHRCRRAMCGPAPAPALIYTDPAVRRRDSQRQAYQRARASLRRAFA